MKCEKCNLSISSDSKFCSSCGAEIKKDPLSSLEETIDACSKTWFMLGFIKGCFSKNKKERKVLKGFEDSLKDKLPETWEKYNNAIKYMGEAISEDEEISRPKRKSISKTKEMQKE